MVSVRTAKGKSAAINTIIKPTIAHAVAVGPTGKPMIVKSARLTIRSDEAARRTIADTDGTMRRARQVAETNRLI
jgi:Flp pilus assembly protein CpaB